MDAIAILDVPVQPLTWLALRDEIVRRIDARIRTTVMYANIHVVNTAQRDAELRDALHAADIVYCDGDGIRLGAWLLGQRFPERITGADFIYDLARTLAAHRRSIFWIGGPPGIAADALAKLAAQAPGLAIAGAADGYFPKTGPETLTMIDRINAAAPDLLIVGMGTPIQEAWVARHRDRIAAPVVWCIGATAEFVAGTQPRAPRFMQHGFEWLYRLAHEPRRMFGRYVIGNPLFLTRILRARFGLR